MDKRLVREYVERYRAVAEVERQELRTYTAAFRLQQVNSMYQMARSLGLSMANDLKDDLPVYERWARLKRSLE